MNQYYALLLKAIIIVIILFAFSKFTSLLDRKLIHIIEKNKSDFPRKKPDKQLFTFNYNLFGLYIIGICPFLFKFGSQYMIEFRTLEVVIIVLIGSVFFILLDILILKTAIFYKFGEFMSLLSFSLIIFSVIVLLELIKMIIFIRNDMVIMSFLYSIRYIWRMFLVLSILATVFSFLDKKKK